MSEMVRDCLYIFNQTLKSENQTKESGSPLKESAPNMARATKTDNSHTSLMFGDEPVFDEEDEPLV